MPAPASISTTRRARSGTRPGSITRAADCSWKAACVATKWSCRRLRTVRRSSASHGRRWTAGASGSTGNPRPTAARPGSPHSTAPTRAALQRLHQRLEPRQVAQRRKVRVGLVLVAAPHARANRAFDVVERLVRVAGERVCAGEVVEIDRGSAADLDGALEAPDGIGMLF